MKRERCILLQWIAKDTNDASGLLVEQLRYAGLVRVVKESHDDEHEQTVYMLEVKAPRGITGDGVRVWAEQNASRMKSFGFNAADSWRELP